MIYWPSSLKMTTIHQIKAKRNPSLLYEYMDILKIRKKHFFAKEHIIRGNYVKAGLISISIKYDNFSTIHLNITSKFPIHVRWHGIKKMPICWKQWNEGKTKVKLMINRIYHTMHFVISILRYWNRHSFVKFKCCQLPYDISFCMRALYLKYHNTKYLKMKRLIMFFTEKCIYMENF